MNVCLVKSEEQCSTNEYSERNVYKLRGNVINLNLNMDLEADTRTHVSYNFKHWDSSF